MPFTEATAVGRRSLAGTAEGLEREHWTNRKQQQQTIPPTVALTGQQEEQELNRSPNMLQM